MDDFNEFKNQLKKSGRRVLEDSYVRQYTKIWNNYIKSIISNYKSKIDLDSKNVEVVVVEEVLKCNAFVQKVGKTYFIAINHYIIKEVKISVWLLRVLAGLSSFLHPSYICGRFTCGSKSVNI